MGSIERMLRERRSSATPGGAFDPLAQGNPNWQAEGSQDQFEAAAAAKRLDSTQKQAIRTLNQAMASGNNVNRPEFDEIRDVASNRFISETATVGTNILRAISGPFQAAQILLQDVVGGAPAAGKQNPSFGDVTDALFGGLNDPEEFTDRTGLTTSGSNLLTMLGWEEAEADDWQGRIERGIAHFTLDMLTDPLTYVTFGFAGLGRKVVASGAKVWRNGTSTNVFRHLDEMAAAGTKATKATAREAGLSRYEQLLVGQQDDIMRQFTDNPDNVAAMAKLAEMTDIPIAQATRQMAYENQMWKDVIEPALRKDFGNIHELALHEIPNYMRGGIRLGVPNLPFVPRDVLAGGFHIPGTSGLGRRIIRKNPISQMVTKMRAQLPAGQSTRLANKLKSVRKGADLDQPLFDALVDGTMEPWQWTMFMAGRDGIDNSAATGAHHKWLSNLRDESDRLAELGGFDPEEVALSLHRRLDIQDGVGELGPEFSPELDTYLDKVAVEMRTMFDDYHAKMVALDPDFATNHIEGYISHLPGDTGRQFMADILEQAGAAPKIEAWGKGNDAGLGFFARVAAAVGHGGNTAIDEAMGSMRFINRKTGRFQVQSMSLDGGPIQLDREYMQQLLDDGVINPDALQTGYLSAQDINDALEPVFRHVADEVGVPIPKDWDGRFLSQNPFEVAVEYTQSMNDAIQSWELIKALEAANLVLRQNKVIDTQQVVQNLVHQVKEMGQALNDGTGRLTLSFGDTLDSFTPATRAQMGKLGLQTSQEKVGQVGRLYEWMQGTDITLFRTTGQGTVSTEAVETVTQEAIANWKNFKQVSDHSTNGAAVLDILTNPDTGQNILHVRRNPVGTFTSGETEDAFMDLWKRLDYHFTQGDLKGKLTHEGIESFFQSGTMDDTTSLVLHDYLRHKMNTLDGTFVENILRAEPVEIGSMRMLYQDWERGVNSFNTAYAAKRRPDGSIIPGQVLGDDITAKRLEELTELGNRLKKGGVREVADIMSEVKDMTVNNNISGYVKPEKWGIGGKALDDMIVEENTARFLRNMASANAVLNAPEGAVAAKLITNDFLKSWRGLVTLARPTFHIRNAIGAAWMNGLMGVGPRDYARLNGAVSAFREGLGEIITAEGDVRSVEEMIDWAISKVPQGERAAMRSMWDEGVLSGFVQTEFRQSFDSAVTPRKLGWAHVMDTDNFFLTKWGGNIMQNIEDYARGGLFMKYFDEGVEGSNILARDMVNAIHFDYNNLTPWESSVKSLVPFFVWTRRNIPRQLALAAENPGMINKYQHMMQALDDNLGGRDETGFPVGDHFSASAAGTDYYVNPNTPFWARVMIDPDLPINDLQDIPNPLSVPQMIDWLNGLAGPHVTTLFDLNNQREWNDVNAPAPLSTVVKGLAAAGFFDLTPDGDMRIPFIARSMQEIIMPYAREVIDPLTGGPTDPGRQQRLGIAEGDDFLESTLKSTLFTLARGAGVKLSTPTDARQVNARSRDRLNQIIDELRIAGDL